MSKVPYMYRYHIDVYLGFSMCCHVTAIDIIFSNDIDMLYVYIKETVFVLDLKRMSKGSILV
jgi:hypothetical protein